MLFPPKETNTLFTLFFIVTSDGKSCNATQSPDFTSKAFVGAHTSLQVIFPYLIPFILMIYPLVSLGSNLHSIHEEDEVYKSAAKTALIVATSYAVTFTPLAIMQLVIFPAFLGQVLQSVLNLVVIS